MSKKISSKSKFRTELGIPNDELGFMLYPAVTNNVVVSFNLDDCRSTYVETLFEEQVNQLISSIGMSEIYSDSSLAQKKSVLLLSDSQILLSNYMEKGEDRIIKYYKKLFAHLECLTNLKFEVKTFSNDENSSDYRISMCTTKNDILQKSIHAIGYSSFPPGTSPKQCLITIDNMENILNRLIIKSRQVFKSDFENTLGHEFMHCLGLDHPKYQSMKENKKYRSILEDKSPIALECGKTFSDGIAEMKCRKFPTMPTDTDVLTLIDLYGHSLNDSQTCQKIQESFASQYPGIKLETVDHAMSGDQYEDL